MPRAFLKTRSSAGSKTYICVVCGEPIEPGQQYYHWKFFRGALHQQHASHGPPRRGQLTDSKMGELYDAVDDFDVSDAEEVDPIHEALEAVAQSARSVAEQYGESADNIEASWPSGNPTSEACRATQEELESYADTLEAWEPSESDPRESDDEVDEDEMAELVEAWLQGMRDEVIDLVNEHPEYQG